MSKSEREIFCGAVAIGEYLGVSARKVRDLIKNYGLPVFHMGARDITARKASLDRWIEEKEAQSQAQGSR